MRLLSSLEFFRLLCNIIVSPYPLARNNFGENRRITLLFISASFNRGREFDINQFVYKPLGVLGKGLCLIIDTVLSQAKANAIFDILCEKKLRDLSRAMSNLHGWCVYGRCTVGRPKFTKRLFSSSLPLQVASLPKWLRRC